MLWEKFPHKHKKFSEFVLEKTNFKKKNKIKKLQANMQCFNVAAINPPPQPKKNKFFFFRNYRFVRNIFI